MANFTLFSVVNLRSDSSSETITPTGFGGTKDGDVLTQRDATHCGEDARNKSKPDEEGAFKIKQNEHKKESIHKQRNIKATRERFHEEGVMNQS